MFAAAAVSRASRSPPKRTRRPAEEPIFLVRFARPWAGSRLPAALAPPAQPHAAPVVLVVAVAVEELQGADVLGVARGPDALRLAVPVGAAEEPLVSAVR